MQASLLNFLLYNVSGGGKSDLYGVEPPLYYFRNGFNQLQFVLPMACMLPIVFYIYRYVRKDKVKSAAKSTNECSPWMILLVTSPALLWTTAITLLPHKEERFLYVVYPVIILAASAVTVYSKDILSAILPRRIIDGSMALLVLASCVLAVSRTAALVVHYKAPMDVYKALPAIESKERVYVCVGAEWYRYPSSFFLPGAQYRLQFVKSGFDGLLPRPFEEHEGGTKASPKQFNDMNVEEPENYWNSADQCSFFVTLQSNNGASKEWLDSPSMGNSTQAWKQVESFKFLDSANSPSLTRAFYVPFYSSKRNQWLEYVLLQKDSQGI